MTTLPSNSPQGTLDNFDTGPLSWVMVEIREALNRSKAALYEALAQDAESQGTALRHAKNYLHQAHGALQIVDVDGVAIITETIEDLLERSESGQLTLSNEIAQAIAHAYQALLEYLEELLSGVPHQPVRLFPYYRSLLEVRGAERIHPADLFFPNLANRPQLPPLKPLDKPIDYVVLRKRFERALLPFLKSTDRTAELANATLMRDVIGEVERAQSNQPSRGFWWVLHGFAEAVAAGQIKNELYVKQLFACINLQIRRLSEGSSSIAERLLRDALFFIACAENPSPRVQQIRRAYQLDGVVPIDYEKKRYGQIDIGALTIAKERLSHAKNAWNRIAGGDSSVATLFESELNTLTEVSAKLNSPPLLKLLRELGGIARQAAHVKTGENLGLGMATSLLFVENALNHIGHLPDNFTVRAEALASRLLGVVSGERPAEAAQWLDDMSREAQERQTMLVLAGELQTSLRHMEKMLDEYFGDPTQRASLAQIQSILHQIGGALAILDQEDAMLAIQHTQEAVRRFAEAGVDAAPNLEEFQHIARNVGALSFFIETLQLHSEGVKKRFSFDRESGVFHANLIEKHTVTQIDVEVAEEPASASAIENADFIPLVVANANANIPAVEDELVFHPQQSVELALSLTVEPDNPFLHEQIKELPEQGRQDAAMVDNPEANDHAQAAIKTLTHLDAAPLQEMSTEIVTATAPVWSAPEPAVVSQAQVTPDTDEEVDAELLEIFLSEAEEVLACVTETVPHSRNEPYNQDHLTTLRRSFHTLKGSGRMVGLMAFGEAAWSIEQVLNVRLSETKAGDTDLYLLLDKAVDVLSVWVSDLQNFGKSTRTPYELVQAAERVKSGEPFVLEGIAIDAGAFEAPAEATPLEVSTPTLPEPVVDEMSTAFTTQTLIEDIAEPHIIAEIEVAAEYVEEQNDEIPLVAQLDEENRALAAELADGDLVVSLEDLYPIPVAEVIDFPSISKHEMQDDGIKRIGDLEISVPLYNIYLAETDELVRLLSQDIAEWRHEPDRQVNVHIVHAAHSLAGSSATVGFKPLQEVAHALEMTLQYLTRKPIRLIDSEYDTLEHGVERIRFMLQMFALGEMPEHEPEQVEILERMLPEIETRLLSASESAGPISLAEPLLEPHIETIGAKPDAAHAEIIAVTTSVLESAEIADAELPILESAHLLEEPERAQTSEYEQLMAKSLEPGPIEHAEPTVDAEPEPSSELLPSPEISVMEPAFESVHLEGEPEPVQTFEYEQLMAMSPEPEPIEQAETIIDAESESLSEFLPSPEIGVMESAFESAHLEGEPERVQTFEYEHLMAMSPGPEPIEQAEPIIDAESESLSELLPSPEIDMMEPASESAHLEGEPERVQTFEYEQLMAMSLEPGPIEQAEPTIDVESESLSELLPSPEIGVMEPAPESVHLEGVPERVQTSEYEQLMAISPEPEQIELVEPLTEPGPESLREFQSEALQGPEAEPVQDVAPVTEPTVAELEVILQEAALELDAAPQSEYPVSEQPEQPQEFELRELELQQGAGAVPAQFDEPAVTSFAEPVFAQGEETIADPVALPSLKDELDADLLPVFLEEGRDMLPQMGQELRTWQKNPADAAAPNAILRLLHTIKGSARMAGAMSLGQHMHEMETRIEQMSRFGLPSAAALDDLLARHDQGLQLFEELQNPQAAQSVAASPAVTASETKRHAAEEEVQPRGLVELKALMPLPRANFVTQRSISANKPVAPAAPVSLVRVRADILDRLVNQAGEVSISRSKLETEIGTLRQSLTEMTENVARLRDQLREIEMQAETQITSRMAHSADREFDPLEFDRFTRLQELTRMMAESVNDVGSVQQNLARTVDNASADLITQGRLTRDLQQDLMRVRMVQFASISERLYRVTRQASKELDKRVNLDIRGSAVEIDRSVLEKMAGPFEHLLRNSIVHGIETREVRQAAGKSDIGELLVAIRQEGNEVVIQFSDDGQGLNLDNIRKKAKATGLLGDDEDVSDIEVTDLIFHPGFSTAEQVTELAGRGVGMDVVRSEAAALGGRVAVVSEAGKGAHFTVHLPLTLAVTQVVILMTGGKTYAVPSVLVEQVQQLKTNPLAAAYNDGAVMWQNQRVPMHYLSGLLGDKKAAPVTQQYSPVIILKSDNDRVAIHVDEILGNREVVVKNIGPQLARMIGIAGATVLGSGEIVLILNPVPLAQRFANESMRAPRLTPVDFPDGLKAVAEVSVESPPDAPKVEPVQGLRTQSIVMVVDDSLTVRRVTQRLLTREGYQVVLAKDGVDALEHLQSITPDVMLVDIEMPRMDGFDLTRNVRGDDRTRHIPIIMITSRTATKHRNYAMELGVNEYLGKPYQEDALLKSIAEFIGKEIPAN